MQPKIDPKILIILNPLSGKGIGKKICREFCNYLENRAAHFSVYETAKNYDVDGIKEAILKEKPDILSIIGGDGTIQNTLNAIPDFSIDIHLLPGGSGNDLVYSFAGGKDYEASFETVFSNNIRPLDMGTCNGEYFINGLGIGFDGEIVKKTQKQATIILPAAWKYHLAVIRGVFGYQEFEAELITDSEKYPLKHLMISVANGIMYGGGFKVAPDAIPDDGKLDIISISNVPPIKRIFNLPKIKKGKHMNLPYISNHQGSNIKIVSKSPLPAHLDGEYFEATEFDIQVSDQKFNLLIAH